MLEEYADIFGSKTGRLGKWREIRSREERELMELVESGDLDLEDLEEAGRAVGLGL